jgi:hypothetical protein
LWRNVALALGSVVIALTLCEICMRAAGISFPRFDRPDALLGGSLIPGASGWYTQEGHAFVAINAAGFRDRDRDLVPPPGGLRIAVLGDSFTEARHVAQEETFAAVAERALAGCAALADRPAEILNFGVSGYGTAQELLLLRERVWSWHPNEVVLAFFVGNDLRNNTQPLQKGGRPYFVYQDGRLVLDSSFNDSFGQRLRTGPLGQRFYALLPHVRVLQLLMEATELRRRSEQLARFEEEKRTATLEAGEEPGLDNQVYREPSDPDWQLAWRTTEDLLRMMRDDVRSHGARFLLLTLSTGIQVNPDPAVRARFAQKLGADPDLLYPDRRARAPKRPVGACTDSRTRSRAGVTGTSSDTAPRARSSRRRSARKRAARRLPRLRPAAAACGRAPRRRRDGRGCARSRRAASPR